MSHDTNHDPFAACEERAVIRLTLADDTTLTGSYTTRAGFHFIHCTGRDRPPMGEVFGPFSASQVRSVLILKTRDEVLLHDYERLYGERVPGRDPVSRDDYQYRLETLARVVVQTHDDWRRQMQVKRQFDEVADRICLAAPKRAWLLRAAQWSQHSNAPPTMADIWVANVASPSHLARPRPQDFDPDPVERHRRQQPPAYVTHDPRSIPNMLRAFHAAALTARITRLGDPPWDRGHIQIDLPLKGRSRFLAIGERDEAGSMLWRVLWDGNDTKAGLKSYRQAVRAGYRDQLGAILQTGLMIRQPDLFGHAA